MFRFEDPGWLLLGLLLAPILYRYARRKGSAALRFPSLELFGRLTPQTSVGLRHGLMVLRATGIGLMILALARPQAGQKETEILSEGVDIVLCLDTSGSMQALDFELDGRRVDRLAVVKKVVLDFIQKRKNDRIGMVVFGEQAFTQCPLTLDYGVLMSFLDRLRIGMAGDSTAIGSALATSVKRIKDVPGKSKVVILLTDGRNNTGRISPQTAAELAKTFGVKVYTIGVGQEGESPFLVDTLFGKRYVYQKVDLDEDTLRKIADTTGGMYFRATDTASLEKIYDQIDQMEKSKVEVKEYTEYEELFPRFVLAGLLLLLAEFLLAQTWFAKIP
jgi:Ca-activated chloride channel family protein